VAPRHVLLAGIVLRRKRDIAKFGQIFICLLQSHIYDILHLMLANKDQIAAMPLLQKEANQQLFDRVSNGRVFPSTLLNPF
jgi:hypothetical protein